jgi:putative lipoprotein (rSAM/lipoprotein system)
MKKRLIKSTNWVLAGILSILGFAGCEKIGAEEYGTPSADYTVKGTVVNKATGKPIKGIRVGYVSAFYFGTMYGVIPTNYQPKASVTTNEKGEFKLTDRFFPYNDQTLPVFVEDIDEQENGLFQSERFDVDFSKAVHSGKPGHWYDGEYTVNVNMELTEIKGE